MHCDGMKIIENKDGKLCILTVFKTIWKCREHFENKDAYACFMTLFETVFESAMFDLINVGVR